MFQQKYGLFDCISKLYLSVLLNTTITFEESSDTSKNLYEMRQVHGLYTAECYSFNVFPIPIFVLKLSLLFPCRRDITQTEGSP